MKRLVVLFALLLVTFFVACRENPVGVQSLNTMEIKPDTLRGSIDQVLGIKARVDGVDPSELYYRWTFGNVDTLNGYGAEISYTYHVSGMYSVTAQAFDYFTDSLVAKKSIPAIITEPTPSLTILPYSLDSTVKPDNTGILNAPIQISVTPAISYYDLKIMMHIVGPNLDSTFDYLLFTEYGGMYKFTHTGTYTVEAEAKRLNGDLYARDTAIYTLRMPQVSLALLQSEPRISVVLYVDSASPIVFSKNFIDPLNISLPLTTSSTNSFSWAGNSFSLRYTLDSNSAPTFISDDEQINGSMSSDFSRLDLSNVSANDTSYIGNVGTKINWSFIAQHLQLVSVNDNGVFYYASGVPMSAFIPNINYYYNSQDFNASSGDCGSTLPILPEINPHEAGWLKVPRIYVIFSK